MTSAPWVTNVNSAPWNQPQAVFNRLVDVHRLKTVAGSGGNIGQVGYSGAEQGTGAAGETVLYTKLLATIQIGSAGRTQKGGLPGDAVTKPVWNIIIKASAITQYAIRDRDIIVDDEFYRYEVGAAFWNALGYQLSTIRLEA